MSKICVYDHAEISVHYLEDQKVIHHTVHKPTGGQVLRDALTAGSDALAKYGVIKWLSDDRKNGPLPIEDIQWGASYWHPLTIKAGWKYWAVVVPPELIAAGTLMPVIESLYGLGVRVNVFTTVEEALDWLDSQPN